MSLKINSQHTVTLLGHRHGHGVRVRDNPPFPTGTHLPFKRHRPAAFTVTFWKGLGSESLKINTQHTLSRGEDLLAVPWTLIRGSADGTVEPGRYRQETLDLAASVSRETDAVGSLGLLRTKMEICGTRRNVGDTSFTVVTSKYYVASSSSSNY